MIRYQEEKITKGIIEEVYPLLEEHERELNLLSVPLDFNKLRYIKANIEGMNVLYTVREDGGIIGYALYWLSYNLHYGLKQAQQDILFVSKAKRTGRTGIKLLKYSEKKLKEDKEVELILQHTKKAKDLGRLLEYLGYKESDKIYCKEL